MACAITEMYCPSWTSLSAAFPREMLAWINRDSPPSLATVCRWSHDYLESQDKSGHTEHYRKHFPDLALDRLPLPRRAIASRRPPLTVSR